LSEAAAHFDLLRLLVVRELRSRYARTGLGVAWAIFPPLLTTAVFTAVNVGSLLGGQSRWRDVSYPLFALSGLVFWLHFSQSLTSGTTSLALARDMIHKSSFPAEVIPLSKVLAGLLDLGIGFVLLLGFLAWKAEGVPWTAALVPAVFVLQLAFTVGVVLFASALNLFFRDVQFVLQVLVTIAMFASDVVVPVEGARGRAAELLMLNPMVSCLEAYRSLLLLGRIPSFVELLPAIVGAPVALALGAAYFRRVSPRFAEEV
jgi:homopolymeric O-antigen transport system permease protein